MSALNHEDVFMQVMIFWKDILGEKNFTTNGVNVAYLLQQVRGVDNIELNTRK